MVGVFDTSFTSGGDDNGPTSSCRGVERRLAVAGRALPSAGARHPFETYILVHRVNDLPPGLYRYLPLDHKLLILRDDSVVLDQAAEAFMPWVQHSAVIFLWTVVPYRSEWRYAFVAHKMIAQESGHICQNLYLAAESIGAGACATQAQPDAGF